MAYRVQRSQLGVLSSWLKRYLPDSARAYGLTLSNQRGLEEDEIWADRWPDVSTVLVKTPHQTGVQKKDPNNSMAVYTKDIDNCYNLLRKNVDWRQPFVFHAVQLTVKLTIDKICREENVLTGLDECGIAQVDKTTEDGKSHEWNSSIMDGFHLGPLKEEDARLVSARWPYTGPDTEDYLAYTIRTYPSVGIGDASGTLVAWGLVHRDWAPAMLHVEPDFRKRGFARVVFGRLTQIILNEGIAPISRIVTDNRDSIEFHKRCGYKMVRKDGIFYIYSKSNT